MVLPAPAPHDEPGQDDARWVARIQLALRLAQSGILVLVDEAHPARLRELVQGLLPAHRELEVHTDVRVVHEVPDGSTLILAPRQEDAEWLNLERPVIARRGLRVVLWCDAATSRALAQQATDFYDWISHRVVCPEGVPLHAVEGLRCALAARAPGILWFGAGLQACFRKVRPGRELCFVDAGLRYDNVVQAASTAGSRWVAWSGVDNPRRLQRVRWALAETRRRTRTILVDPAVPSPGWWPVDSEMEPLAEARAKLASAGARYPGRLAAVSGLEPGTIALLAALLRRDLDEATLESELLGAADPGVVLARLAEDRGLVSMADVAFGEATAPALRAFGGCARVRSVRRDLLDRIRTRLTSGDAVSPGDAGWWAAWETAELDRELLSAWPNRLQAITAEAWIRRAGTDAADWRALADVALAADEPAVTEAWLQRSMHSDGARAGRVRSAARALRGDYAEAEALLRRSMESLEASLGTDNPEYAESLRELGALLTQRGRYAEAEEALRRALEIQERELGSEHPDSAATSVALAILFARKGRYGEALQRLRDALESQRGTLGEDHPAYAMTLKELGSVQAALGNREEAEESLRRALEIQERVLGPQHPSGAATMRTLARVVHAPTRVSKTGRNESVVHDDGKAPALSSTVGAGELVGEEEEKQKARLEQLLWVGMRLAILRSGMFWLIVGLLASIATAALIYWTDPTPSINGLNRLIAFINCFWIVASLLSGAVARSRSKRLISEICNFVVPVLWVHRAGAKISVYTDPLGIDGHEVILNSARADELVQLMLKRFPDATMTADESVVLKRRGRWLPAVVRDGRAQRAR